MTVHKDYACPECKGEGTVTCGECGHEHDCEDCSGSGVDYSRLDENAFNAAERAARATTPNRAIWALIEGGFEVGWQTATHKLYYESFVIDREPKIPRPHISQAKDIPFTEAKP